MNKKIIIGSETIKTESEQETLDPSIISTRTLSRTMGTGWYRYKFVLPTMPGIKRANLSINKFSFNDDEMLHYHGEKTVKQAAILAERFKLNPYNMVMPNYRQALAMYCDIDLKRALLQRGIAVIPYIEPIGQLDRNVSLATYFGTHFTDRDKYDFYAIYLDSRKIHLFELNGKTFRDDWAVFFGIHQYYYG